MILRKAGASLTVFLHPLLMAATGLGLSALAAYGYHSWQEEKDHLMSENAVLTKFAAVSAQATFDELGKAMVQTADAIREGNAAATAQPLLFQLKARHPEIGAVTIYDKSGHRITEIVGTFGGRPAFPMEVRNHPDLMPAFRAALYSPAPYTVERTISNPHVHEYVYAMRTAISNRQGAPEYLLQISVPLKTQTGLWANLNLPQGTSIGLQRDDHYLQARWPAANQDEAFLQPRPPGAPILLTILSGRPSGTFDAQSFIDRTHIIGSYERLARLPMAAYVATDRSVVWTRWWAHARGPLAISALALFALNLFGAALLRKDRKHRRALQRQAEIDSLTGLPNRGAMENYLKRRIAVSPDGKDAFAVMFLDLDKFKFVNDTVGHACGDQVLKEVGVRLGAQLRDQDMLARLGGDEFLAVVTCDGRNLAEQIAERLLAAMASPFHVAGRQFRLSLSIGVSLYPGRADSASDLLQQADIAMYTIKNNTRNGVAFFDPAMTEAVHRTHALQEELQEALERNEFRLDYQPKYDAARRMTGVEALVRWQHPQRGLLMPGSFIDLAEESGLIVPIGAWVLREACRQMAHWHRLGYADLTVSVNAAVRQFEQSDFTSQVWQTLADCRLEPAALEIEITESLLAKDRDAMTLHLDSLVALGVKIALDDFGTGYSSLSYLRQFSIQTLKIDRSFVSDILDDPNDAELTNAIIAMGHALNMKVVAEGVENEAQLDYLVKRHCDVFQGYLFSKPVPAAQVEALLVAEGRLPVERAAPAESNGF